MLQEHYRISIDRILAWGTMLLIYIYHFVYWQYWYLIDEEIFTNYLTLLKAAELVSVTDPLSWTVSGDWYTVLIYLFPLLLLFQNQWPRLSFYLIFFSGYFIPNMPYQSVILIGTVDEAIFMLSVGAVGLLLARDIQKSQLFSKSFEKVVCSTLFKGVTALLALSVVLVSIFVNTARAIEVANTAAQIGNESLAMVQIGLPFLQAIIFLFCASGVFIMTRTPRIAFIIMSWLVILMPWQFRLEPASFSLLLELYIYCSAMVVWRSLAPKGTPVESYSTGVSS